MNSIDILSPSAVLVIDVQRGLFRKSTPIYRADNLLANINTLVDTARQAGALVVFIQHSSEKNLVFGSDDWLIHPELHPQPCDLLIHKRQGNAFLDTPLHAGLATRGVQTLAISGLVTHGCVKATCLGALELGYRAVLVADAHSSYSKDAASLISEWNQKLEQQGAFVAQSAAVQFSAVPIHA